MKEKYQIFIKDEAKKDIQNAYNWYKKKQKSLGSRFKNNLKYTFQQTLIGEFAKKILPKAFGRMTCQLFPSKNYLFHYWNFLQFITSQFSQY